jgi:hypothetical protein
MAAIYDKALKRKDFSGIIDKEKQREAAEKRSAEASESSRPPTPAGQSLFHSGIRSPC